jgi:hypothetical protein
MIRTYDNELLNTALSICAREVLLHLTEVGLRFAASISMSLFRVDRDRATTCQCIYVPFLAKAEVSHEKVF